MQMPWICTENEKYTITIKQNIRTGYCIYSPRTSLLLWTLSAATLSTTIRSPSCQWPSTKGSQLPEEGMVVTIKRKLMHHGFIVLLWSYLRRLTDARSTLSRPVFSFEPRLCRVESVSMLKTVSAFDTSTWQIVKHIYKYLPRLITAVDAVTTSGLGNSLHDVQLGAKFKQCM